MTTSTSETAEPSDGGAVDFDAGNARSRALAYLANSAASVLATFNEHVGDEKRRADVADFLESTASAVGPLGEITDGVIDSRLRELFYYAGRQREASLFGIELPLYSTFSSYDVNSVQPWSRPPRIKPVAPGRAWSFLGRLIDFPIGVPASALTGNAEWIALLFRGGYNVVTTKTFRSRSKEALQAPNWIFLPEMDHSLPPGTPLAEYQFIGDQSGWRGEKFSANISTANSFGVPSKAPEDWQQVVRDSIKVADERQVLIVSVMGDVYDEDRDRPVSDQRQILVDDYVRVAGLAAEAGATTIELNLSCPNSLIGDNVPPPLCLEAEAEQQGICGEIVAAVRASLPADIRLLVKLSYMDTAELQDLVFQLSAGIDGISGINTLQAPVKSANGLDAFGKRNLAGISGFAIRDYAMKFVRDLSELRARENLTYEIIGIGGVTNPDSFINLYTAGAAVVQSATGVFADYALAQKCIKAFGANLPSTPPVSSDVQASALTSAVRSAFLRSSSSLLSRSMLLAETDLALGQVNSAIELLVSEKKIIASENRYGLLQYELADFQ